MGFFERITAAGIAGLVIFAAGAAVTFLSGRITARIQGRHAGLIVKLAGLGLAVAGFALVMGFGK